MARAPLLPSQIIAPFFQVLPVDVDGAAKALGFTHVVAELPGDTPLRIERLDDDTWRITTPPDQSPRERRFALTHAIAHYVLHRDILDRAFDDDPVHDETRVYQSHLPKPVEFQASRYAATLIMPGELVARAHAGGHRTARALSDICDVPAAVADLRMTELGLASGKTRRL